MLAAATGSESITGQTLAVLYLDEFSKVPQHVATDFIASTFPSVERGRTSKIIITSTSKGLNHFYEFWTKAIKGMKPGADPNKSSNFYPIKVAWYEVPGHDKNWADTMIANYGQKFFMQEFQCVCSQTIITVKNKQTNVVKSIKISELFKNIDDDF